MLPVRPDLEDLSMNRTSPVMRRPMPALGVALTVLGLLAFAPHPAAASVAVASADLSTLFGGSGTGGTTNSFLNLSSLLGYAMYFGIPTVAVIAGIRVIMSIRDNPDLGHIMLGAGQMAVILGFAVALWQLPSKMTGQSTAATSGAVIVPIVKHVSPRA
jgi:hypothetical protein